MSEAELPPDADIRAHQSDWILVFSWDNVTKKHIKLFRHYIFSSFALLDRSEISGTLADFVGWVIGQHILGNG